MWVGFFEAGNFLSIPHLSMHSFIVALSTNRHKSAEAARNNNCKNLHVWIFRGAGLLALTTYRDANVVSAQG